MAGDSFFAAATRPHPRPAPRRGVDARRRPRDCPSSGAARMSTDVTVDPIARQRPSAHAVPALPAVPAAVRRRPARPAVADPARRGRAPLVRGRPARRQPGPDRPDVPRAQAADVHAAGADGLQGDRGRLPGRQPDRLRLRPAAHRAGPDPGRRHHPGAGPVPRAPDRPDLRVDPRRQAGHRALLQLDLDAAAPGGVRPGQGRHHRHRHHRRPALPEVRGDPHPGHRDLLRVLARSRTPAPSWTTRWRSARRSST